MRSISATMKKKLASRIQAGENAISASLWVGRPTTPLTEDRFLEKQTVLSSENITKTSIAVCHPRLMRGATEVYIGYLESGTIKIAKTTYVEEMERHVWENDIGYSQVADDFCLCFDGTMPKAPNGYVEFKTEQLPWVFWTLDGVLYGRKLWDESEPIVLAEANCSAVSAIRAMWSSYGSFDFGLVVFFLLNGQLYYRQLISGEWMDAEVVSFGPSGIIWEALAAFRTWDYRIGVQLKATNGTFYEMFTQFMGVGKQNAEHLSIDLRPDANLVGINYIKHELTENVGVKINPIGSRIYAWSSKPTSAYNVDDGTGNYGLIVYVTFDYPVSNVENNSSAFTMIDISGVSYACSEASSSEDGLTVKLIFTDFNLSEGKELTVSYSPGTILSPATSLDAFSFTFMPVGLVAPEIPVPEPVEAWNLDEEGTQVGIRFTESLTGDVTGYDTPAGYKQQSIDMSNVVVTTLNQYSSSYSGAKAIDGSASTYWRGTTTVNWIAFQFSEPKAVTSLRMITAGYYIKTFTLSGSNDGESWTQLGEIHTVENPSSGVWNEFSIDNNTKYLHYRIDVLTGSSRIYLYELDLLERVAVGNETKFEVSGQVYNYVPDGTLFNENRIVTKVEPDVDDDRVIILSFASGNVNNLQNMDNDVTLKYGGGTLMGLGGPVAEFELLFTPEGLVPKNHPNANEHVDALIVPSGKLTKITYGDASETEHVAVAIQPNGTLISIDDI